MLIGLVLAALGGLLTLGSYSAASSSGSSDGGGTYVFFTGLILVGGFNFIRGLIAYSAEQKYQRPPLPRSSVAPRMTPQPRPDSIESPNTSGQMPGQRDAEYLLRRQPATYMKMVRTGQIAPLPGFSAEMTPKKIPPRPDH
jgi:hypothetical protein